jgi:hypothetical protein
MSAADADDLLLTQPYLAMAHGRARRALTCPASGIFEALHLIPD